jgi:hypothetical protein
MNLIDDKLLTVMRRVKPIAHLPPPGAGLAQLGFDSLSVVSLFVELETEFSLSIEAMSRCLHAGCTIASLVELCGPAPG